MKITINGKISQEALQVVLSNQEQKVNVINDYCKKKKLKQLSYKDSELEYEYTQDIKPKTKKVEVRDNVKRN